MPPTPPTFGHPLGVPRHRRHLPRPNQLALGLWSADEIADRRHLVALPGGATHDPEPTADVIALRARRAA